MGLVAGEQDPLAFLLAQAVGHLAATAFAAIHAFPITGELPPSFTGAGTSSNPFLKDLKGFLAIVRGRQSSPSSPQKAWIFLRQSTVLQPPPGLFPYCADPVLAV